MNSVAAVVEDRSSPPVAASRLPRPTCRVGPLTPQASAAWDAYVREHQDGTLFHTIAWRDAVKHAFDHEDFYLVAERGGRIVGVCPLFLVASRFVGRMLVSVPYGVGGGILADDHDAVIQLFAAARRNADERGCRAIDLRSERAVVPDLPVIDRYVGFRRELPPTPEEVLGWLPRKARAAARNARHKFELRVSYGDEHLRGVWRLYTISMRRLASLNYPLSFFQRLIELTPNRHWVSRVDFDGRPVAGLVTFLFKDRVMPYFLGTTPEAPKCHASNFVYLCAMERGVEDGYRVFDFGRTRRDNQGSFDFKRFQGFEPRPLAYQLFTAPGQAPPDLSPTNPRYSWARRTWGRLPLVITRPVGARLCKHFPG